MKIKTATEITYLIKRYPELVEVESSIVEVIELLLTAYRMEKKVLVCGNGGSAADSLHIVGELMKDFALKRPLVNTLQNKLHHAYPEFAEFYSENLQMPLTALSIVNEVALTTAYMNDRVGELVMAQQVLGHAKKGDVLLVLSTSGNSENIIHAARIAKVLDVKVVALTGKDGGRLKELADVTINVPSEITYQIQELHLPIYHTICLALEQEFFGREE